MLTYFVKATALLLLITTVPALAGSEIVVAMRYYQDAGVSHSHLYLYRADGKLLRELTNDNTADDVNPLFSPDGSLIVFTRYRGKVMDFWSIKSKGEDLTHSASAPDWYMKLVNDRKPSNSESILKTVPEQSDVIPSGEPDKEMYKLLGGGKLVVNKHNAEDQTQLPDQLSLDVTEKDGRTHSFSYNENYPIGLQSIGSDDNHHILYDPKSGLRMGFISVHYDSTIGNGTVACDLNSDTTHVCYSKGHGEPSPECPESVDAYPLPAEPAFLSWTSIRYVPYGSHNKTENSSFIERLDGQFHQINYSHPGAGQCYGASLYRSDYLPRAIWLVWPTQKAHVDDGKGLIWW